MTRICCIRTLSTRLASAWLLSIAVAPVFGASEVAAQTPLTRATITQLRNRVRLKPRNEKLRKAKARDVLRPGAQVATGRAAFAEFQFNEGTLARMGERAIFRFKPRSRDFVLSKGTVLLLIPPGQGRTRVRTPNVRTGISGSALFVRHDEASNTTLVGALTDSGIEVGDLSNGPSQVLKAGQMVVAVDGEIEGLYDFDLKTFFESSPLTEGVLRGEAGSNKVLEEIQVGLKAQGNFEAASAQPVLETPSFVKLSQTEAEADGAVGGLVEAAVLESTPGDGLASVEASVFPGRSLGLLSVEADEVSMPGAKPPAALRPVEPESPVEPEPPVEPESPVEPEPPIEPEPPVDPGNLERPPIPIEPLEPPLDLGPVEGPGQDDDDDFPGRGNGVEDGFPGRGNGVEDGFPGGDDEDVEQEADD